MRDLPPFLGEHFVDKWLWVGWGSGGQTNKQNAINKQTKCNKQTKQIRWQGGPGDEGFSFTLRREQFTDRPDKYEAFLTWTFALRIEEVTRPKGGGSLSLSEESNLQTDDGESPFHFKDVQETRWQMMAQRLAMFASDVRRFSLRFRRHVSFLQKCTTFPQIRKVPGIPATYPSIKYQTK